MTRYIGLDLLKIVATLAVVFLHTLNKYSGYSNVILYQLCSFAVPVFFMINGYFVLNKKDISFRYISMKIVKIILVCLFWNLFRMIQRMIMGLGYYTPIQETINIFFEQSGFFFQFWFFGSLIMIYILLPILHKIHQYRKIDRYFMISLILLCLFIHFIDMYSSYKIGTSFFLEHIKQPLRIWTWITYFYLGGFIKIYSQYFQKWSLSYSFLFLLILSLVNVVYQVKIGQYLHFEWAEYFYDSLFMMLWCISLFVFFCNDFFDHINEKLSNFITSISQMTMGCFILHIVFIVNIRSIYKYNLPYFNILIAFFIFVLCILITFILKKIPLVRHTVSI